MRLKFPLLPAGQPFTWRGDRLIKNGPVTATDANGQHQMVPRSALVSPEAGGGSGELAAADSPGRRLANAGEALRSGLGERLHRRFRIG